MSNATGLARIEALLRGEGVPLREGDTDWEAVGCMQDLLAGFRSGKGKNKSPRNPDLRSPEYGRFGKSTAKAVRRFQEAYGLRVADPKHPVVDQATLRQMLQAIPNDPRVSVCYAKLRLKDGRPLDPFERQITFVTLFETNGYFLRFNLNTDHKGLSFGLIQWAQVPARLGELIDALIEADRVAVLELLEPLLPGVADPVAELKRYLAKERNGATKDGRPTDARFNFVGIDWVAKFFRRVALNPRFQAVQLEVARQAFKKDRAAMKSACPRIVSDRGAAFLADLANQHGAGAAGGKKGAIPIYERAVKAVGESATEKEILERMAEISIGILEKQYGKQSQEARSTRSRRRWFLDDRRFLSDDPFQDEAPPPAPVPGPLPEPTPAPGPKPVPAPLIPPREEIRDLPVIILG